MKPAATIALIARVQRETRLVSAIELCQEADRLVKRVAELEEGDCPKCAERRASKAQSMRKYRKGKK